VRPILHQLTGSKKQVFTTCTSIKIQTGEQAEQDFSLGGLKISIQNCNALSLRCSEEIYCAKMAALTCTGSDIVFLCDIRLSDPSCIVKVKNSLISNPANGYNFYFNSTKNSRGVGILISCKLDIEILNEFRDIEENILGMKVRINGKTVLLVSIYGPNGTDGVFYDNLNQLLGENNGESIILGGDWNCVQDQNKPEENIDIINMLSVPNQPNGKRLRKLCTDFNLIDPFRELYPDKKEFTYFPFGNMRNNRSRLDFFCISSDIMNWVYNVDISPNMSTKYFDHRKVTLLFRSGFDTKAKQSKIKNLHLKDRLLEFSVLTATYEVYYYAFDTNSRNIRGIQVNRQLGEIKNRCRILINEALQLRMKIYDTNCLEHLLYEGKLTELVMLINDGPSLEELESLPKNCSSTVFFEALTNRIRETTVSIQKRITTADKRYKNSLDSKLKVLKSNYNINFEKIKTLETELQKIIDIEFEQLRLENKKFECLQNEKANQHFLNMAKIRKKEVGLESIKKTGR